MDEENKITTLQNTDTNIWTERAQRCLVIFQGTDVLCYVMNNHEPTVRDPSILAGNRSYEEYFWLQKSDTRFAAVVDGGILLHAC